MTVVHYILYLYEFSTYRSHPILQIEEKKRKKGVYGVRGTVHLFSEEERTFLLLS